MPLGFGHRKASSVQGRVRLVDRAWPVGEEPLEDTAGKQISYSSTAAADFKVLPEVSLEQCVAAAARLNPDMKPPPEVGNHCVLVVPGCGEDGLEEGGIYEVQIRIGDGHRWSPWSLPSAPFRHTVPQPQPSRSPEACLQVDTLSSSVARLRWPPFEVLQGIREVEFKLTAELVRQGSSLHGARSVTTMIVLDVTGADMLEAEISHLLPATEYRFSVAARYPRIGWRSWGPSITSEPTMLKDTVADWPAPPAPAVLPTRGPAPFLLAEDGGPMFLGGERAFFIGFPDTTNLTEGQSYRLEYKHVGLHVGDNALAVDYRSQWLEPPQVTPVELPADKNTSLAAHVAPWKFPPRLWQVCLPRVADIAEQQQGDQQLSATHLQAQMQRVQFRLAATKREECPVTRWFSVPSPPLSSAIAPPESVTAALRAADDQLGVTVTFALNLRLACGSFWGARDERQLQQALQQVETMSSGISSELSQELPIGFGHSFATHFQMRSRFSPRPPSPPPEPGAKPPGVPWSKWTDGFDAALPAACTEDQLRPSYSVPLILPSGEALSFNTWYQVAVRLGDGLCWSDWSEPSVPVKVYVAPPKAAAVDTATVDVDAGGGGSNVTISWLPLKAHAQLKLLEYAVYVREVLHDHHEICPRQLVGVLSGYAISTLTSKQAQQALSYELRDLRHDVSYIFTVAARYPNVGAREFEDAVHSQVTSLQRACSPLPVPMQMPLPADRLRKLQGSRCVLLKWSHIGLLNGDAGSGAAEAALDAMQTFAQEDYELQALPANATHDAWTACRDVQTMKVDGALGFLVKDIPGNALRCRFRLWHQATGRYGRASPLMLTMIEPVAHIGVSRSVSTASSELILRAPLTALHGSQEYVCRYQVQYRTASVGAEWQTLPVQMLWHQHNDHLSSLDAAVDAKGAVQSGLESGTQPAEGDDGAAEGSHPALAPEMPTIPLACVSTTGHVTKQRCIIARVHEGDGLDPDRSYEFSIRVGDLFRLSEWSPPSAAATLGVPPPVIPEELTAECGAFSIAAITDTTIHALWPPFIPAKEAGVPRSAGIEYLLTVVPVPGKRRMAGAKARPAEDELRTHSQWFLQSAAAESGDEIRDPLGVFITGLQPYTAYDLKLAVRYARVGTRKWRDAISYVCTTKKPNADFSAAAVTATSREVFPGTAAPLALPRDRPCSAAATVAKVQESPRRRPESPRRLPPLEVSRNDNGAMTLVHVEEPDGEEPPVDEWLAAAQGDLERIVGSVAAVAPSLRGVAGKENGEPNGVGYPARPLGQPYLAMRRRDPRDPRPTMPLMPDDGGKMKI